MYNPTKQFNLKENQKQKKLQFKNFYSEKHRSEK